MEPIRNEAEPIPLHGLVVADTFTLRRLSASAVRFRLGRQLDWRIDLMLDSTGLHLLSLRGLYVITADREIETLFEIAEDEIGNKVPSEMKNPTLDGEVIVRSVAMLKLPFTDEPHQADLDLRIRDYVSLPPAEPRRGPKRADETSYIQLDMRGKDFIPDADTPNIDAASQRLRDLPESPLTGLQRIYR